MKALTLKQINTILDNNSISSCTESEKKQVFTYAFGGEFMGSNDKGSLKHY